MRTPDSAVRAAPATHNRRVAVLWFPDWPVYVQAQSRGWDALAPAAVIADYRVLACNAAARAQGIRIGMKQRHALAAFPQLNVAADDPTRQASVHEDVLAALQDVSAVVETLRPGLLAFPVDSLARYYGNEASAVEKLLDAAARIHADCLAGVADDLVSAVWAARLGKSIPVGGSAAFIAELPISVLSIEPELRAPARLSATLQQLGLRTMRDFAGLPRADVAARFGQEAVEWHRIASGHVDRDVAPLRHREDLELRYEADEPIARTETAAFIARHVATALHNKLFAAGEACLRLAVRAYLEPPVGYTGPTVIERLWRCREPLSEQDTAQRVRWQLDGWLTRLRAGTGTVGEADLHSDGRGGVDGETGVLDVSDWVDNTVGVTCIELVPVETVPAGSLAAPLWGGPDEGIRAARAAAGRAQALIGMNRVLRPIHRGGRAVARRIATVPYGEDDPEAVSALPTRQWEGQLLPPLPGLIGAPTNADGAYSADERNPSAAHPAARLALLDRQGDAVYVTGRGLMSSPPATLCWGARRLRITGWAGPWPVDEHWWAEGKRYARLQIAAREETYEGAPKNHAFLLVCKGKQWRIEATY
ncbi:DNA polymerase involved in DNA repair [Corynebacterium jeikeium]|uniref:Y-family DNA polymerase n=1 Tax=Corynebacterium jeikeium TaxID=38289 RepID=UPI000674649F|nr:DNA polymerase Y family protein [Corynebacterium jeikeium]SUY84768.1 DNA polymerase involved in DNA repair [Corynebacterium jeikeium]